MKDDNYIVIQGWMVNQLGLKGNDLMVYALIYGFSQDGENEFTGNAAYVAEWIGSPRVNTALEILKRLTDRGLLMKREKTVNNVKFVSYSAVDAKRGTPTENVVPPRSDVVPPRKTAYPPTENVGNNIIYKTTTKTAADEPTGETKPFAAYCKENNVPMTAGLLEQVREFYEAGITDEMLNHALDEAFKQGHPNAAYIFSCVNDWICNERKTLEDVKTGHEEFRAARAATKERINNRSSPGQPTTPAPKFFSDMD